VRRARWAAICAALVGLTGCSGSLDVGAFTSDAGAPETPSMQLMEPGDAPREGGPDAGTGSGGDASRAQLRINLSSINFGEVPIGTTSTPTTVSVTNVGAVAAGPLSLQVNPPSGEFKPSFQDCTGNTLAPQGSCSVSITLSPSTVGAKSASLTVGDSVDGSVAVKMLGMGVAPAALSIAPSTPDLSCGPVQLTVTNTGGAVTDALSVSIGGRVFSVDSDNCSGRTLGVGASCTVQVRVTVAMTDTNGYYGVLLVEGGSVRVAAQLSGSSVCIV